MPPSGASSRAAVAVTEELSKPPLSCAATALPAPRSRARVRPRKDGFETRLWVMHRLSLGNHNKGILAGWGVDQRDPTADKKLVEFCLGVPMEAYLSEGEPRALAKRALADCLPEIVLNGGRNGYQAADWHEGLTAARSEIAAEIGRLMQCGPAIGMLNVERLHALVENWPTSGWDENRANSCYRLALLRGVAAGHFLRKASRSYA